MKTSRIPVWLLAAGLCLGSAAAAQQQGEGPAAPAAAVGDLLDRPAMVRSRAAHGVTLALAHAGPRLVAVGELGTVLLSDDQGRTWRQAQQVPVSVALTGVQFVSDTEGWAIGHGGVVLHSTDAGEHWTRQLDGRRIGQIALAEAQSRQAAGEDAGRLEHDAELLVKDGPDKPLLGLYFADAERGWVVGAYGIALATTDGGQHWQAIMGRIPNPGGRHLYAITATADGLLIAGEQGRLFGSRDGGQHFERIASDYAGTWFGALPVAGGEVLAFGLRGNAWLYTPAEDAAAVEGTDANDAPRGRWQQLPMGQAATLTAGLRMADGSVLVVDEGAHVFRVKAGEAAVEVFAQAPVPGVSDIESTADGALVLASLRGPYRMETGPARAGEHK